MCHNIFIMKKLVLLTTLLVLSGCAHQKFDKPAPQATASLTKTDKKSKELGKTRAIFHIIEPVGVELILFHVDDQREEKVLVDKTLSQIGMTPGHWQVKGFVLQGRRFEFMNDGQKFIFTLKPGKFSYVGSYLIQCPKVGPQHGKQLKKMSFFNRYPFRSNSKLCELVVGSDFENVNRVWTQLNSAKKKRLTLGF
jgi:hypothetical protein